MTDTQDQPVIESRTKGALTVDGLTFKDLDGDGQLAPYEDWRLSPRERAADLLTRMSSDEKTGLMIIGSHFMGDSPMAPNPTEGKLLNEDDNWADKHPISGVPFERPVLASSGARQGILERHQRFYIVRDNPDADRLAQWANALQEVAESSRLGIPVVLTSNPRNHVSVNPPTFGITEAAGAFADFPGELGLAATQNAELARAFGDVCRQQWRASGLHKMYGYMADMPTEPRWSRVNGTFGEDVDLVSAIVKNVTLGMQGESLGPDSLAATVKHFPGGGVRLDGHDPHFSWGQTNEYSTSGSLETYHLPPFQAAIDAGASSIMPYYSKPVNTSAEVMPKHLWFAESPEQQFAEVTFAYDATIIGRLLRDDMGHRGYINSDSGIIDAMPWGVEDLTEPERFARAVQAGVAIFSDMSDPTQLREAVAQGLLTDADLDRACAGLLTEIFTLGLFENPYVDPDRAQALADDAGFRELGDRTQQRSVTLLRNDAHLLPLDPTALAGQRVYVDVQARANGDYIAGSVRDALAAAAPGVTLVESPQGADLAIVWLRPSINLFADDQEGRPISVDPRDNGVDVDRVREIEAAASTVLVVNVTNPWLLADVEPGAKAVAATYEISAPNLAAVLLGQGEPGGRLPVTLPRSAQAVADSPRDVPGKDCGPDYPYVDAAGSTYAYGFGLGFDGNPIG